MRAPWLKNYNNHKKAEPDLNSDRKTYEEGVLGELPARASAMDGGLSWGRRSLGKRENSYSKARMMPANLWGGEFTKGNPEASAG